MFFFLRVILKRTSTEAHVYVRRQDAKVKHFDIRNVIYHKFSHGAVSYTLNGENVNVLLEYVLMKCDVEILKVGSCPYNNKPVQFSFVLFCVAFK